MAAEQTTLSRILFGMLRPIVRFAVRRSIPIQEFIEILKRAYVEVVTQELTTRGTKANASKISLMSGMYRDDVTRILKSDNETITETPNTLWRIVGQWQNDARFCTKKGSPRLLSYETGTESEFRSLVESVSKRFHYGTVYNEMLRLKMIEKTNYGVRLRMDTGGYIHAPEEGFDIMSQEFDTLSEAVEENLLNRGKTVNLHIRTEYDNVAAPALPEIKQWLVQEGKLFHKRARDYISSFDKDINPQLGDEVPGGGKVVLSAFSLTTAPKQTDSD